MLIPYQPGQRWVKKYYDSRTVTLQGTMFASTGVLLESRMDQLKALFPLDLGEQKLEVQQLDGSFRYLMAEVRNLLIPTTGKGYPIGTKWSIELIASDPIWYGSQLEAGVARTAWAFDSGVMFDDGAHWFDTTAISFTQILSASPVNVEASNAGNYYTRKPVFSLSSSTNPKIVNLRNGYSLQITGSGAMVIDCGAQTVNGANAIVTLGAGQTDWLRLESGENTLRITGAAGAAYTAQYSPAYL